MRCIRNLIACALVLGLAGCADLTNNRDTAIGAGGGGVLGAVIGNQVSHGTGTYVGAALGALAGGAVGHYMDNQRHDMEQKLAKEQAAKELQISQLPDGSLKVGVASDATFDVDSAQLKPQALQTYAKIASVLKDYPKTVVWVVGHTDSTGTAQYNQQLSERRAQAVGSTIISDGLPGQRVRELGRGESGPVASNDTAEGRQQNRRVDIIIQPIVQGKENQAYVPPA